ncbi:MAG: hypothetical protein ACD_10C00509G0005 [uncultured bacterium]|nr:MAG: hypothetical protein ACD_10C00509G0005 [uncultured bacterium]
MNREMATIGPTVCELEGPIPMRNTSNTLNGMKLSSIESAIVEIYQKIRCCYGILVSAGKFNRLPPCSPERLRTRLLSYCSAPVLAK